MKNYNNTTSQTPRLRFRQLIDKKVNASVEALKKKYITKFGFKWKSNY